jgi:glutamyl-tRNA reductase
MDEIARSEAAARLARAEGISEAVVLATRERTEFIVWAEDPSEAANSILQLLSQRFALKLCEWERFYRLTDKAAIAHVFSGVCGGTAEPDEDPTVLRDALKVAWMQAQTTGTSGRMLDTLFAKALALAEGTSEAAAISADAIATEAKLLQKSLLAERLVPAAAVVRVRVEDICRRELEALERALAPLNEPQRDALAESKVRVTKRIAGEVEHELKSLKQTARQENLAETAQRLISHGQMRDVITRSHN